MRLTKFRVRNFRSVDDSGWIDTDQVTALIGTNESGKTNILVPLWKLKPAKDGAIDPIADYPRKRYNEIRSMTRKPVFIEARFVLSESETARVSELLKVTLEEAREAIVAKDFDGKTYVSFPAAGSGPVVDRAVVLKELDAAQADISAAKVTEAEQPLLSGITDALARGREVASESPTSELDVSDLQEMDDILASVDLAGASGPSVVAARFGQLVQAVTGFSAPVPEADKAQARQSVVDAMPSFVYYSNYGNLDSEIYLPHVIQNLKRKDLGPREQAKARTLKVLFDFVNLSPEEILKLGEDVSIPAPNADQQAQIAAIAKKKKERDILLQSASTDLTRRFREWWRQGNYRFRFAADGNHFRIWVSDDKRPEDIELEGRSTGLQWFFSFYLVFLVESEDSHQGSVLLLDEPGLLLHPLAQSDLSEFFDGLAETNQLLYTTHSPFLVDSDQLDRARAVFTNDVGVTQVSPDLRAPEGNSDQAKSVYAAYAALRMSVSDTLLLGCQPVVVEGPSDQHYLTGIKNYLVSKGVLRPKRDILFMPSGGVKGTKAVCALVMGRDDKLPYALLDSDETGTKFANGLKSSLYVGDKERVLTVGDFVSLKNAEIEDLLPPEFLTRVVDRYLPKPSGLDEDFADIRQAGIAIVPQVEAYAEKNGITLEDGWRVEVSRRAKTALLKPKDDTHGVSAEFEAVWGRVFAAFLSQEAEVEAG